ncbi:AraC family transcriptional regulator [Litoribrevibacter albus]|uniref:Transcriptional regulator n=1 Tax=Litoribrevibacter albus TaxID=1473156 RepID=A0AA37SCG4_9GAMM|nr:AraC family transcriptional regulator [Litoribrevibacter albus]GLQ31923.1 transcriptional regulator [Litoribrevibacter albus]
MPIDKVSEQNKPESAPHNLGTASVPPILQYLDCSKAMGIDIKSALINSRFPAHLLEDDTARIQGTDFQALLLELIRTCKSENFGLSTSQYVQPASYVVLGYISMNCRTVKEALEKAMPYEKLVGDMGVTEFEDIDIGGKTGIKMTWKCNYTHPEVIPHMVDNVLASWVTYCRWLSNRPEQAPEEIWLTREKPSNQETEQQYREIFRCPIKFGQPSNSLFISQQQLEMPLRRADPLLLQTLEQHAQTQLNELTSDQDIVIKATRALKEIMKSEPPRKERLAETLGISGRTLQRKLQAADSSYQELLDQVRKESAEYYLAYTQLSMGDIASHLGFSDTRSFHRSFKLWSNTTPGEFRQLKQGS